MRCLWIRLVFFFLFFCSLLCLLFATWEKCWIFCAAFVCVETMTCVHLPEIYFDFSRKPGEKTHWCALFSPHIFYKYILNKFRKEKKLRILISSGRTGHLVFSSFIFFFISQTIKADICVPFNFQVWDSFSFS